MPLCFCRRFSTSPKRVSRLPGIGPGFATRILFESAIEMCLIVIANFQHGDFNFLTAPNVLPSVSYALSHDVCVNCQTRVTSENQRVLGRPGPSRQGRGPLLGRQLEEVQRLGPRSVLPEYEAPGCEKGERPGINGRLHPGPGRISFDEWNRGRDESDFVNSRASSVRTVPQWHRQNWRERPSLVELKHSQRS